MDKPNLNWTYLLIALAIFSMGMVGQYLVLTSNYSDKPKSVQTQVIAWDSIEKRVYAEYGEGDAAVEQLLYLKTGVHQDFMGKVYTRNYDYYVNVDDSGTTVYNLYGKFVDRIPFDSTSNWDKAILKDNL